MHILTARSHIDVKNQLLFLLLGLSLLRLILSVSKESFIFIDFLSYLDATHALFHKLNPFDMSNLIIKNGLTGNPWTEPPLFFPAQFSFFLPFLLFSPQHANILFFILNTLLLLFGSYFFVYAFTQNKTLSLLSTFILFNSAPALTALRHGQLSIIVPALFLGALYVQNRWLQAFFLALAGALKFSLLPFLGLLFLMKKKYFLVFSSSLFFVSLLLSPLLFGHNIITLLSDYQEAIHKTTTSLSGHNNYGGISTYNFIHFEFFKPQWINMIGKVSMLGLAIYTLFKERKERKTSLTALLLLYMLTLSIAYHRVYDATFALLLLLPIAISSQNILPRLLLLWFIIPESITYRFYRILASFSQNQQLIWVSSDTQKNSYINPLFPGDACLVTILLGLSIYLYFSKKKKASYEPLYI